MGAIIRTGFKNIMFDQLSGEVEQKISRLKKSNNTFTKRCMVVPSVMRHSSASIVHSRRRNGSSKTNLDLPGQRFELAYSHFNLMFLRFWFEWSFGRECDAYDKLGSGKNKRPVPLDGTGEVADVGLYELFSSDSTTLFPSLRPLWICSSGLAFSEFPGKKPSTTGYWKIKLETGSLEAFVPKLVQWRFSYAIKKDVLYFSNSLSASLGLPPNAKHLGFPKIDLVPNFDGFGGLAVTPGLEIVKEKKTAVKDAMCQIAKVLTLDYQDWIWCEKALMVAFKDLEWGLINKFCLLVYQNSDRFDCDDFLLWLDAYIRKVAGVSKF